MTIHSSSIPLRIGTRGSPLALAQAHEVRSRLGAAFAELSAPEAIQIVVLKTTGDLVQNRPLSEIGGKGLFTKEIDDAQLNGHIDLAVHSVKDVPTVLPDGIIMPCVLPREDPRDAFLSLGVKTLADLPQGAVVGTSSLRRTAQVLLFRPDLRIAPLRGNVHTRLRKLEEGSIDATLLAVAGLRRLGLSEHARFPLDPGVMLPAVAQGAIGVACRSEDDRARRYLAGINDPVSMVRIVAERAFLAVLDGSCRTPIAALATVGPDGMLMLRGQIARPDGTKSFETTYAGASADAEKMGQDAGRELLDRAGPGFFDFKQAQ